MTDSPIDAGSNEAARKALASLIDLHGPALLHEPDRLKRQLDGALPDARRAVELILSSMGEEVPHALLAAHSEEQLRTLFPQLVDRLVRKTGVEAGAATWSVRTWAHALAVTVEGRDVARPDGMRRAVDRHASNGGSRTAGDSRSNDASSERKMLEDREAARRSSAAEVLGFGTRPVRLKAPSTVRPPGPIVSPPPAAETLVAFDASRERAVDLVPDQGADAPIDDAAFHPPVVEAEARTAQTVDAVPEAVLPAAVIAPTPVPEPMAPIASAQDPFTTLAAHAPADDEPLPVAGSEARTEAPAPPAAEAAPVVVPEIRIPVTPPVVRVDAVQHPAPESAEEEPALAFPPQRRSSSRTFALAAAIAAAVIVVGATLWPAPQPRSTPEPKPPASATAPGPIPAPATVAAATVAPATITPAPVVPTPVDKPSEPVVAETPPTSTTGPQNAPAVRAPDPEPVAPPVREALPVGAEVTAPTVIPLTPPVPKRAPAVVRKPEAPVAKQVVVASAEPKPAKAAEPRKPTAPAACTRSTCGSVVSVRAIDDAATRDYEVIVRLDDRTIRAVRMPARWSPGARVRVAGSRFEPVDDR